MTRMISNQTEAQRMESETDGGYGGDDLAKFKLVENSSLSSCIETDLDR